MASRAFARCRTEALKNSYRPRPRSFAWYIAASASRTTSSAARFQSLVVAADARSDRHLVPVDDERHGQGRLDPLGQHPDDVVRGEVLAQDDELVTARARDGVAAAHRRRQPAGDLLEQCVPGGVPEAVVDDLEPVQVQEQDRDDRRYPLELLQRVLGQPEVGHVAAGDEDPGHHAVLVDDGSEAGVDVELPRPVVVHRAPPGHRCRAPAAASTPTRPSRRRAGRARGWCGRGSPRWGVRSPRRPSG